ncbi:MAG: hypothetical protein DRI90_15230 [Deltaproteobacteria bacterium]|nr:MAG: hypothetical protein DRI90_15230 [Deltaproteobacteria bacterium]
MVATEIRSSAIFNFFPDGASWVDAEPLEWFCRLILCRVVRFQLSAPLRVSPSENHTGAARRFLP